MKSSKRVIYISGKYTKYIYYDGENYTCYFNLFVKVNYDLYCTELYKLYSNFGGNYIPYGDGFHTASLMIDVYEDINEQSVYVREDEI